MNARRPATPKGARIGVIGLGRMGARHAEAAQRLGMEICALADVSAEVLSSARATLSAPQALCFTDPFEMLDSVRPQAVAIATTAPSHAALVLKAAEVGVGHILCEKPMATSLSDADAMIHACERSGSVLAVNHQMRFMPQYTRVKQLLGGEALGPLVSIIVAGSNFGLAMNASHYFEMFRFMADQPVASIQAWLERDSLANPRGPQFEDRSGRLLARSANGVSMYVDFSADAGWGLQVVYICRFGQIVVDELNGDLRVAARKAEFRNLPTSRYGMPVDIGHETIDPADVVEPTMAVWLAMYRSADFPDGSAGAHALACLVAAHASDRVGGAPMAVDSPALPRLESFSWA
jgi:predicted dehydrogenase